MTTATLEARVSLPMTTDGAPCGYKARDLAELTTDLTSALNGAIWSYMLRAELEEAFDTALLRAAMSETPTLSGTGLFAAN
jgi:hypothetical protein